MRNAHSRRGALLIRAIAVAVLSAAAPLAAAQDAPPKADVVSSPLPDTPAGKAMGWLVEALNAPREADLEGRFSQSYLDDLNGDIELVRPMLIRVWGETRGVRVLHTGAHLPEQLETVLEG